MTGCGHGYETGEKIPYANSYSRTNTNSDVRLNERIEEYKVLIDACKEHMVLEDRKASFGIETVTYKEIEKEYKNFSLKYHPDRHSHKSSDEQKEAAEIFKAGNEPWTDLKNKLVGEGISLEKLKSVTKALLTHVKEHLLNGQTTCL